ncbi:unnamed protein product [Porites evermanni]|uniref:DUF1308 domain-containing protein n=1 Tax=Porites evermanni TaxID=104178 RepID=A0ABN8L9W7_9CNID|nr:unnamed protein product [Porites evermanni]
MAAKWSALTLEDRIEKAEKLFERSQNLQKSIEGLSKLKRKILAEVKFLKSLSVDTTPLKDSHMKSTNLLFLEAVLATAEEEKDVCAVFKPFWDITRELSYVVDVVADNGYYWIKVTARNASALHRTWQGHGDFGDKDIVHQAKELQAVSKQHLLNYSAPVIMVSSFNGITESLAKALANIDVCVKGQVLPDPGKEALVGHVDQRLINYFSPHKKQCDCVNLDITTMIAYISSLTNGGCRFVFKESILTEQAKEERRNPVLPKLKEFLEGKKLFACQSAVRDFDDILRTVGGEKEQQRARALLDQVTVVEDNPSVRSTCLQPSASIKERSKIIFGTGDSLKAITATANVGFTRAAASQGVEFSVFLHESRALTESKEFQASPICESGQDVT